MAKKKSRTKKVKKKTLDLGLIITIIFHRPCMPFLLKLQMLLLVLYTLLFQTFLQKNRLMLLASFNSISACQNLILFQPGLCIRKEVGKMAKKKSRTSISMHS